MGNDSSKVVEGMVKVVVEIYSSMEEEGMVKVGVVIYSSMKV